ncbi:putative 25-hydroxycholesterol 7-alpha-hydroxylase [Rhypophila decipiens]|uniref:25-hydroxycholesterol 7-alpha-hydroxylase n=1 Tax=Rhypophila decipiens TaxID=261697 RepID=A0AAN6XTK7_9PEZI|nr:putative 25-hydroxycholesterol 7-alpha-hydroxylase [Rhypophila decipiens]
MNPLSEVAMSHPILVVAAGTAVATYMLLSSLLRLTQDPKEPPLVLSTLPFLSPILGMVKWSMDFYVHMRETYPNLSIYTLRFPGIRIYVVNSTALVVEVQRKWRTLIFPPVSAHASEFAMGGSKKALAIIRADMATEAGFMHGFTKAIRPALSCEPALDQLTGNALEVMSGSLDSIVRDGGQNVKLVDWVRHNLLLATTDSVYGPSNPLRDPKNETAWHTFHPTIMFLMLNLVPLSVFRKAIKARDSLANSFHQYHTQRQYEQGSHYIRLWTEYFVSQGIPDEDIAKFHNGGLFALIANTIPTAFWMIYRVFSDPSVVEDCRREVLKAVDFDEKSGVCTINIPCINRSTCPALVSTFQEVFRVHGMANSVRLATEDTHLDGGKYLIKKGGLVMLPARVQHRLHGGAWGPYDVDKFVHRRFVRNMKDSAEPSQSIPNPSAAFRGFGGGTTLCPGRHFATTEILGLAAMLLLRFDLVPVAADGGERQEWILPPTKNSSQAEAMEQPDHDIDVQLRPRKEFAGKKWQISFGEEGSDGHKTALAVEDLSE